MIGAGAGAAGVSFFAGTFSAGGTAATVPVRLPGTGGLVVAAAVAFVGAEADPTGFAMEGADVAAGPGAAASGGAGVGVAAAGVAFDEAGVAGGAPPDAPESSDGVETAAC